MPKINKNIINIERAFERVKPIITKGHYKYATTIVNKLYKQSVEQDFKKGIFLYYENYINILFETNKNHLVVPLLLDVIDKSKGFEIYKLGNFYTILGIVLSRLNDFSNSYYYLQKGLAANLNALQKDKNNIIFSYIGLVDNSFRQNLFDKALSYIDLGFVYVYKIESDKEYNHSCFYLRVYTVRTLIKKEEIEKAFKEFKKLKEIEKVLNKKDSARYKELELELGIYFSSFSQLEFITKAMNLIKLSIELENLNQRKRILNLLKDFYLKKKDFKIAYKYSNQLIKLIANEKQQNIPILSSKNIGLPKGFINEDKEEVEIYLKDELKAVLKFQNSFFKKNINEKLAVNTLFKPSQTISGDYIGIFNLDKEDMHYLFILADTVGKGIAASYLSFMLNGIIEAIVYNSYSFQLKNIIKHINSILADTFKEEGFVSLWAGILNLNNNTLESVNAGHLPTFILSENNKLTKLTKGTTILGMFKILPFIESETISFNKGSSLITYSDGVTETINYNGIQYEDKFHSLINYYKDNRSIDFINYLKADINLFKDYSQEQDDLSCLVIDY